VKAQGIIEARTSDYDGKIMVTIQAGPEVRRIECDVVLVFAAIKEESDEERGTPLQTWALSAGDARWIPQVLATPLKMALDLGELSQALATCLTFDYSRTAAAIGRALTFHAQHKEEKRGETKGEPPGVQGAGEGPRADSGGEESPRPGGPGPSEQPQEPSEEGDD